ncbi:uncharacterized protein FMAN_14260 [Fusarium mangiferae]|uniref:Uncharacterized protein n=1 Tax=Fusarium mangiferae TaxID=192010 RepID=A0A1L7UMV4_FUSMA|nr:uncharacterized protein FMAN_14260 [Fusarium mangiferae]CVL09097.1 uncharacterized protein FMAN_14260 [Fusarium mangiferae]
MSATPAIRTVVGDDSTSQEAQDCIHQFPIIFINLGGVAKLHIGMKGSAQELHSSILFSWSDDGEITRYGDFQLTMDKFRQIPDYFISRAEEICDKLMFDIKPDIDLAAIKDDMVNMSSGYSFVKHPANHLDKAYLDLLYSGYASRETSYEAGGDACWGPLHSMWSNSASA